MTEAEDVVDDAQPPTEELVRVVALVWVTEYDVTCPAWPALTAVRVRQYVDLEPRRINP